MQDGLLGHFFYLLSFSLSLGDGVIESEILSQRVILGFRFSLLLPRFYPKSAISMAHEWQRPRVCLQKDTISRKLPKKGSCLKLFQSQ